MSVGMVRVKGRFYRTGAIKFVSEPYARIMEKVGFRRATDDEIMAYRGARVALHEPEPNVPDLADVENDIAAVRADYERIVGKKPFMGWDEAKLREKIADALKDADAS